MNGKIYGSPFILLELPRLFILSLLHLNNYELHSNFRMM